MMGERSANVLPASGAVAVPPRTPNRGGTNYIPELLGQGVDTLKETFDVLFRPDVWGRLEDAKQQAADIDPRGKGIVDIELGGENFHMHAHGRRGSVFLLTNDDLEVVIRGRALEWAVSVEYRSAGLWEHDVEPMRARARAVVGALGDPRSADCERLSAVHWAMDFHSPEFTDEIGTALFNAWVCISKVKKHMHGKALDMAVHGAGERVETMTVGSKASLQVQVYDKGREIREVSGKEWMAEVYRANGHALADGLADIWRVELRFGKAWLKDRNIRTWEAFKEAREQLLREALETRRLAVPGEDSNRSRWPTHPLWGACLDAAGKPAEYVPRQRFVVGKRADLMERAEAGIAGYLRAAVVIDIGGWDVDTLQEVAERCVARAVRDPQHKRKLGRVLERYRYVDEAA